MRPAADTKAPARERIAGDLEEWLAAGNRIERIPTGLSGDTAITQPAQRRKGGRPKAFRIKDR